MKEMLRNPIFYTVAVPAIAGLWLLYSWIYAYPASTKQWDNKKKEYEEAQKTLEQIVTIEPQRLSRQQQKGKENAFDYTNVVDQFAKQFGIAPSNYTLNVRPATKRASQTIKSADLTVKTIDIESLCKFVSAILLTWPELDCDQLGIERLPAGKNNWKVSLRFTYTY